ncbi:hypothetical protein JOQ06_009151 [Pogonophryne albipinna]|uniref:Uncharacterized protein n=1 Tax=Pogonophryne albipinna TaxID=1090488 RepID=A0AAD6BQB8_9TELE|nr:hypothetical protein JOQ06_009151 [Pogonophryne albipinna]
MPLARYSSHLCASPKESPRLHNTGTFITGLSRYRIFIGTPLFVFKAMLILIEIEMKWEKSLKRVLCEMETNDEADTTKRVTKPNWRYVDSDEEEEEKGPAKKRAHLDEEERPISKKKIEIVKGSGVFCKRDAWKASIHTTSGTAMVPTLLLGTFPLETLLQSNLNGGKPKRGDGEQLEALDPGKKAAIIEWLPNFKEANITEYEPVRGQSGGKKRGEW